jgi:hypothetical protein
MSSRAWSLRMRRINAATSSGSEWSQRTATPLPPAAVTSSAVSSIVSGRFIGERPDLVERPLPYTVAPSAPSSMAIARPQPRVAPATRATLPASGRSAMDMGQL